MLHELKNPEGNVFIEGEVFTAMLFEVIVPVRAGTAGAVVFEGEIRVVVLELSALVELPFPRAFDMVSENFLS